MESNFKESEEKITSSPFLGQFNFNSMKSKGVIKGQGGQRCESRSKVIKFIL